MKSQFTKSTFALGLAAVGAVALAQFDPATLVAAGDLLTPTLNGVGTSPNLNGFGTSPQGVGTSPQGIGTSPL